MASRASRRLVAVLVLLLVAADCSGPPIAGDPQPGTAGSAVTKSVQATAQPVTTSTVTDRVITRIVSMKTAEGIRTAIVHHPATAARGAPLIVVLHPAATSAAQTESSFGWDAIADRDHLVVAYPEGLLDGYQDTWNAGACCAPAVDLRTNDIGFLEALVVALQGTDKIGTKVYAVGFSNGAMLAYAWACTRPGRLAAVGVVAGAVMIPCPSPTPLTVVAVHGTADRSIPIGGGPGPAGAKFPALIGSLAPFRTAARCPAHPTVIAVGKATVSSWSCADGHQVISDVIRGVDHSWPGAGARSGSGTGPMDATGFLWSRLRATGR